jgi:ribosomal protein L34E
MIVETAAVAAVGSVVTQARGLLKSLRQGNLSDEHKSQVAEALDLISDVGDRLLSIQTSLLAMQQENATLRASIAEAQHWQSRRNEYSLFRTPEGATVLVSNAPIRHYACPACAEAKKELQVLQQMKGNRVGTCPACKASYWVGESR